MSSVQYQSKYTIFQPAGLFLLILFSSPSTTFGSSSTEAKVILETALTSFESSKDVGAACIALESLRYLNFRKMEITQLEEIVKV